MSFKKLAKDVGIKLSGEGLTPVLWPVSSGFSGSKMVRAKTILAKEWR